MRFSGMIQPKKWEMQIKSYHSICSSEKKVSLGRNIHLHVSLEGSDSADPAFWEPSNVEAGVANTWWLVATLDARTGEDYQPVLGFYQFCKHGVTSFLSIGQRDTSAYLSTV